MNQKVLDLRNWLISGSFSQQVEIETIGDCGFVVKHDDIMVAQTRQDNHGEWYVEIYDKSHWRTDDYCYQLSDIVEAMCAMKRLNYMIIFSFS